MVASAAQLILKEEREKGHDIRHLDHYVSVQINDTHPSLIIPELIRLLINEGIPMKKAADIVTNVCGYTNHTILAEALEKWPLPYLMEVVPHLIPIIEGLDYAVYCAFNANPDLAIIDDENRVHMARMDMHFSHSINGVAALHTDILKRQELKPFYNVYASRFNNKTNGITFRRFLMHSNHELSDFIDSLIGEGWKNDAYHLEELLRYYNDENVLDRLVDIKHNNKIRCAKMIKEREGIDVDPDSVFDVQIKRMHEYKRQQMNALWVIYTYLQIKRGNKPQRPITVIFGGKAAPAYIMAKNVIHLILCLQQLINNDPEVSPWLKVVMITNYNVHKAEKLVPACDISEQISLASKEASGTGNMKFMLNGAVTLGTMDGANVEMYEEVGEDNMFIFGLSSEEVMNYEKNGGYDPMQIFNEDEEIRQVLVQLVNGTYSPDDPERFRPLYNSLLQRQGMDPADRYFILKDFRSYAQAQHDICEAFKDQKRWAKMAIMNTACVGKFSSDRTIQEYVDDIWHLDKVKLPARRRRRKTASAE